jgi:hypothetical protein
VGRWREEINLIPKGKEFQRHISHHLHQSESKIMPEDFNKLEIAVLAWLQTHYKNEPLSAQIESAKFISRKWTQVGFYVYLSVSAELRQLDMSDFQGRRHISGPEIQSVDVEHNGGSILWCKEGYINCIEMYTFGNYFNEKVTEFILLP